MKKKSLDKIKKKIQQVKADINSVENSINSQEEVLKRIDLSSNEEIKDNNSRRNKNISEVMNIAFPNGKIPDILTK